ncbi:MAG: HAMP domain-containing histidine kinase, partial [Actinomycetota bacterium]|nr:HAMP domain-containing histidine kinase [Actinomycetota bacterium]
MTTSIRLRLALSQAFIFAAMAMALVAGIYVLTARSITAQSPDPRSRVERALGLPPGTLFGKRPIKGQFSRPRDRRSPRKLPLPSGRDRRTLGEIAAGVQAQTRSQLLKKLIVFSGFLVVAATLLTLGVGWFMANRSLRPLRRITARAKTLSAGNLHEPIALHGPKDELRELADTFDEMLARLDRAFAGQRLFAANASHELRTPLTRIRTKLDVTLAKSDVTRADLEHMADTIRGAIDQSTALIDSLLTLARARGELRCEAVAVHEIAGMVLEDLQIVASSKSVEIATTLQPCTVSGDPVLLEHLVRNLLENAIIHNVEHGWVRVGTTIDDMAHVRVANSGRLMAPSSIEALFVPLHRGYEDRMHIPGRG